MNKAFEKILERLEELKEYDLCNGILCSDCEEKYGGDGCGVRQQDLAIDECKAIIQEVAKEYKGGWIPCSERLPEDGSDVLVQFEYYRYGNYNRLFQTIGISYTYNGEWSGFVNGSSGWSDLRIIAWQPLPQPYKERD